MPGGDIAVMATRAALGVLLRRVEDEGDLAAVARAVREHISDPEYPAELAMWSGRHGSRRPGPQHPSAEQQGRFRPGLRQPGARPAASRLSRPATMPGGAGAGHRHRRLPALLAAGRGRTGAVLLTATALGLASCPLTEPLELADTRRRGATKLLDGDGFRRCCFAHRVAALNADPLPRTPRRLLSEAVAVRLDGSALQAQD